LRRDGGVAAVPDPAKRHGAPANDSPAPSPFTLVDDDTTAGEGHIDRLVRLAHEHLGMEVVCVAEFTGGKQVYRAISGDAASFGMKLDDGPRLESTYCSLMVDEKIPNVIPDSSQDSRVRDFPPTQSAGIGAYVGVPLYLPDGELYGSFCGLSHTPETNLNARDVHFMTLLGAFVADELAKDRRRRTRHQAISDILTTSDLQIALQPVVHLQTGRCLGMEALARFPGDRRPDEVFDSADRVGLRHELETLAAVEAFARLRLLGEDQVLGINLSPNVAYALAPRGAPADRPLHRLMLEITEHAVVDNYPMIRKRLQPMRERGLRLAIDDAGAGYASLRHVIELQPDIIKIDRSLITGIDNDQARRSAVTTFVLLALDIGAQVLAEGVETLAELDVVTSLGVDAAQGYLLGRPSTDLEQIARWATAPTLLPPP
jgi:EAL domain-containing protein (putative c-di-GMP-specific phosphodiesterase class I)